MLTYLYNSLALFLSSSFFNFFWWHLFAFGCLIGVVQIIKYLVDLRR